MVFDSTPTIDIEPELFVKEISARFGIPLHRFKTIYDCTSLVIAVVMPLVCFGEIRGIGIGTVVCAVVYGLLIRLFSRLFEKNWEFRDRFPLRSKFTERESVL